jgi:hypothetical protein
MSYLGDYATGQTVYVHFNTFDSNDPSNAVTITGLATSDIEIYKNGVATTRSSDSGYTLLDTDGIDFDSHTGIHGFSIDLSDNTDSGFFAAGNEYAVIVDSITVDGGTVQFLAATFSIERTSGAIAQLKAMLDGNNRVDVGSWLGTAVTTSATTSLPEVDAKSISDNAAAADNVQANIGNLDAPVSTVDTVVDGIQTDLSNGTDGLGAIKTAVDAIPTSNPTAAAIADAVLQESIDDHKATAASLAEHIDALKTDTTNIVADTNELQTDWANAGRLDAILDAIKVEVDKIDAAHAEPSGVPAANETPLDKLGYLFMALRNQVDVTASKKQFYDDGGAVEWEKDLSDDGTTYSETEGNAP